MLVGVCTWFCPWVISPGQLSFHEAERVCRHWADMRRADILLLLWVRFMWACIKGNSFSWVSRHAGHMLGCTSIQGVIMSACSYVSACTCVVCHQACSMGLGLQAHAPRQAAQPSQLASQQAFDAQQWCHWAHRCIWSLITAGSRQRPSVCSIQQLPSARVLS